MISKQAGRVEFDPALHELLLRETGSPPGETPPEDLESDMVPVVAKLVDPTMQTERLIVVARFGSIVTGRASLKEIGQLRLHPNIESLKASREYVPNLAISVPEIEASQEILRAQLGDDGVSGRGVVVGVADWGCDFAHANFRDSAGNSRVLYLWDQRGGAESTSPMPFGYGREFDRERINAALKSDDPYTALSYDCADADPDRTGAHGTHVLDIAAGNGLAEGASAGVAPQADIIFVHLKGNDTRLQDTLGDSVRLLEAVRYIVDRAGDRPVAINLSLGWTGGPHDGMTLVEQGLDALLDEAPGCIVCMSTGNYFNANLHSSGTLQSGEQVDLQWEVMPRNDETAEMEVWYAGTDNFDVELIDPYGRSAARVALSERSLVYDDDRIIASVYNRRHDPTNGKNHVDIFLWPDAPVGTWTTRLYGEHIQDGRYGAWIERDDPYSQSKFVPECAVPTCTTNTICNGRHTIAVGAYDARHPSHALIPPSSSGPTADNRAKPDISAPGAGIRAARSSEPNGSREMNGFTVKTGASMAAPHVTGVCALMFEAAGEHRLTPAQTRQILIDTARTSPPYDETDRLRYGAGRVDAAAAVKAVRALVQQEQSLHQHGPSVSHYPASAENETSDTDIEARVLRQRLAEIMPAQLVVLGDSELDRIDENGAPIYDPRQPLLFAPSNRRYSLTSNGLNYHAANFVFNTAYRLGYEVPVYPFYGGSSRSGRSYYNLAATFEALLGRGSADAQSYFDQFFEIVAPPGLPLRAVIREGDLFLRGAEPGLPFGHIAIIVDGSLHNMTGSAFRKRDAACGRGIQCIEAGLSIVRVSDRYGRTLVNDQGVVWNSRLIIRFKENAIDTARVLHQIETDTEYRGLLESTPFADASLHAVSGGV